MDDGALASLADASYFDWWRVWASSIDGGDVREEDGLLLVATGVPQAWWNVAAVVRPLHRPEAAIQGAVAHFGRRGQRFILRVREGVDPATERAAEAAGFVYTDTLPGMTLFPIPPAAAAPASLEIRTVADAATLEDHVQVAAAAFGIEAGGARRLLPMRHVLHPRWRSYVGYAEGQPVAASALLITEDIAGVYWVGTLEAFRGRGYGEAMTWHAVREGAAAGCRAATLQASDLGLPIYRRMGFRTVAGYKTYLPPRDG